MWVLAMPISKFLCNTFQYKMTKCEGGKLLWKIEAEKPEKEKEMESTKGESYFVFMNYDPEYERLRADRTNEGAYKLDLYLSKKHDELLASTLEAGSYQKTISLVIVDGFSVEITEDQANVLRSAQEVRVVEKNQEFA